MFLIFLIIQMIASFGVQPGQVFDINTEGASKIQIAIGIDNKCYLTAYDTSVDSWTPPQCLHEPDSNYPGAIPTAIHYVPVNNPVEYEPVQDSVKYYPRDYEVVVLESPENEGPDSNPTIATIQEFIEYKVPTSNPPITTSHDFIEYDMNVSMPQETVQMVSQEVLTEAVNLPDQPQDQLMEETVNMSRKTKTANPSLGDESQEDSPIVLGKSKDELVNTDTEKDSKPDSKTDQEKKKNTETTKKKKSANRAPDLKLLAYFLFVVVGLLST